MGTEVVNRKNELVINGVRYPITGELVRKLTSQFADKTVVGSYDVNSMKNLDTWEVPLYPGYVGVQEAQSKESHQGRSWWTDLITEQDGYTVLPRLATEITSFATNRTSPTGFVDGASVWTNEGNAYDTDQSTYAQQANLPSTTWGDYCEFTISSMNIVGIEFTAGGTDATVDQIDVDIYYSSAWHDLYSGAFSRGSQYRYCKAAVAAGVTSVRVRFHHSDASASKAGLLYEIYFLSYNAATALTNVKFGNFNGELYAGIDTILHKLPSGRATLEPIFAFDANITDILIGTNGNLLVYLGDANNYLYMTTAEAFTETNVNDATRGILWDNKMWKMDADGNWWYSTDGDNSATPTWSAGGALADIADEVESLFIGYDADGNDQIYCATNSILKIYDDTNAKWVSTQVKLPNHPNGGKGAAYWSSGHYLSYGLGVRKYEPIEYRDMEVGLIKDDGIPSEYNGEIVKFGAEAASNVLYALIDASQVTGTQKSGLWAYDGIGWRNWWLDTANDGAMHDIIVSSAESGYALYWDCGNTIWYINLQRGIQNPRQLAGTITYDTAGVYVSPDYDAFWPVGNKIGVQARCSVRGDVSADETVTVKYRTNHSNETIDTGWTTLGSAITSAGETTLPMPTSAAPAGTSFRSIQFRLDLVRKAADTDETPVVVYLALDYYKVIPKSWGWIAVLDLSKSSYADKSSEQLIDALITAAETESLVTLVYEDSTKYVKIEDIEISHTTGEYPKGTAKIFLTEI